jgi:hypothetical protein
MTFHGMTFQQIESGATLNPVSNNKCFSERADSSQKFALKMMKNLKKFIKILVVERLIRNLARF